MFGAEASALRFKAALLLQVDWQLSRNRGQTTFFLEPSGFRQRFAACRRVNASRQFRATGQDGGVVAKTVVCPLFSS